MSEHNADFINKIFEDALKDETLLSTLNVDELIEMTNSEHIDYLNESIKVLINKKNKFPVSAIDAARTQKLIHAIYLSNEKNKKIFITNKDIKSKYLGKN